MPNARIRRSTNIERTARVMQLEGLFDVPPSQRSEVEWSVDLPIESKPWNVGLIVGPSGCGKSTIAREMFGSSLVGAMDWPSERAVVDAFPKNLGIKEITGLLSSVGFSSPPSWLRPFSVLSNGEQFRVTMARALADAMSADIDGPEQKRRVVIDEFTSVVDRTVARVASFAIAKAVRRLDMQFIAVSCHHDIVDWLLPDWTYEPATGEFQWRYLRQRPEITIEVQQVHSSAWKLFRHHHYLDRSLNPSARCFAGFARLESRNIDSPFTIPGKPMGSGPRACHGEREEAQLFCHNERNQRNERNQFNERSDCDERNRRDECSESFVSTTGSLSPETFATPAVFTAVLPFPHPTAPGWREHRTVCLPDFQGVGIGNAMSEFVAGLFRASGRPYRSVTSSPSMIGHRARSRNWRMTRLPSTTGYQKLKGFRRTNAVDRMTASFEYVGTPLFEEAKSFGLFAPRPLQKRGKSRT